MGWLIVPVLIAGFLAWTRFWPWTRCGACYGRKGRGLWSTDRAYNRCHRCGGDGELVRPISALLWKRWRDEAARRKLRR